MTPDIERWRRDLWHIPILPLARLRALPEPEQGEAGIYFLWEGDDLVYIGKSRDIRDRIARTVRANKFSRFYAVPRETPFERFTALVLQTPHEHEYCRCLDGTLQNFERAYIAHYTPPFNNLWANGGTT